MSIKRMVTEYLLGMAGMQWHLVDQKSIQHHTVYKRPYHSCYRTTNTLPTPSHFFWILHQPITVKSVKMATARV